jgi:hypothetical protein
LLFGRDFFYGIFGSAAMKKLVLLFFASLSLNLILSQDLLTSSGAYLSNANGSFSLTIGEVISETFNANNFYLTQGFQQNYLLNSQLTTLEEDQYLIYPNPASDVFYLYSEQPLIGELIVLNLSGSIVIKQFFEFQSTTSIPIKDLKQATYFVYFKEDNNKTTFLGNLIKINL